MTSLKLSARLPINGTSCGMKPLVSRIGLGYLERVTVNPVTDLGRSGINLAHRRPHSIAGAFFVPAILRNGGCAWDAFGRAGFQVSRSANPRTVTAIPRLAASGGDSKLGVPPMKHALIPSAALKARAAAHRAMALAALSSNSSLAVRLRRYNHHQLIARDLEALGVSHGQR